MTTELVMNQLALQKQIEKLTRERRLSGDQIDRRLLALRSEIDRLKLGLAALERFLEARHPDFADQIVRIREQITHEVDPEFESLYPSGKE